MSVIKCTAAEISRSSGFLTALNGMVSSCNTVSDRQKFLASSPVVDFDLAPVSALAAELRAAGNEQDYAACCFQWVRDQVTHSADSTSEVVACSASEVVQARVGLCYAKSHLLVALLRASGNPAGFSYQRLSTGSGGSYCLHGLVSIWIEQFGWYRIDPRGGVRGAAASFAPPREQLVYAADQPGEYDLPDCFSEPLAVVVGALRENRSMTELKARLPDVDSPAVSA